MPEGKSKPYQVALYWNMKQFCFNLLSFSLHAFKCVQCYLLPRLLELNKGSNSQGVCNGHVHSAIFKMNNQQGPTVQQSELCSMLCGSLDGTEVQGRMDTCVCTAEPLCSSPGNITSGSDGKASAYNAGDLGLIPGLGRSPGEGNGNPLQYSCLESSMDVGAWQAPVHGAAKSWIRLSK